MASMSVLNQYADTDEKWIQYTSPLTNSTYFHNSELKLTTTVDIRNIKLRQDLLKQYNIVKGNHQFETFMEQSNDKHWLALKLDHGEQSVASSNSSNIDALKSSYWTYLHNYPCHHELPETADAETMTILQLMMVQNLTNDTGDPCTPFSMKDIQGYIDFFDFSKKLGDGAGGMPAAKVVIIANIMSNFYSYRLLNSNMAEKGAKEPRSSLPKTVITFICWRMPPNYLRRFNAAYCEYRRSLQPESWYSFLDNVKKERANASVVSGLLLASSVAFLAVPELVDVAQCLVILSIGLSLGCVTMGFNGEVEEQLSRLRHVPIFQVDPAVANMGRALDEHYLMILLSIVCFYLSVLGFTAYSIYASIGKDILTVKYLFFTVGVFGLLVVVGFVLRWNQRFST